MSLVEAFKDGKIYIKGHRDVSYAKFKELMRILCPDDRGWLDRNEDLNHTNNFMMGGETFFFTDNSRREKVHDFMDMYNEYFNIKETAIEQELW